MDVIRNGEIRHNKTVPNFCYCIEGPEPFVKVSWLLVVELLKYCIVEPEVPDSIPITQLPCDGGLYALVRMP